MRTLTAFFTEPAMIGLGLFCLMSMAMNAWFGWHHGAVLGIGGSIVTAAGYAGAELVKYRQATFIGEAMRSGQRQPARVLAALLVLVFTTLISFQAQVGFIGLVLGDTAVQRQVGATQREATLDLLQAEQRQLAALPPARPTATITADIAAKRTKRSWEWSKGCTVLKGAAERRFCSGLQGLEAELGTARERERLTTSIAARTGGLGGLSTAGTADPVVSVMSWMMAGVSIADLSTAKALWLAGANEIITALGFFAVGWAGRRSEREAPPVTIEQAVRAGVVRHPAVEHLARFRDECLVRAFGVQTPVAEVVEAYGAWCRAHALQPLQTTVLLRVLGSMVSMQGEKVLHLKVQSSAAASAA